MQETNLELIKGNRVASRSVRDWIAPCFRRGRLILISFLTILSTVVLIVSLLPDRYQAQVKILVKRERADPVVNPDPNAQQAMSSLTEEDLNAEVELLKSRDLLQKVVGAAGLDAAVSGSVLHSVLARFRGGSKPADQLRTLRAVQSLDKNLNVEPLKKSKMITVTYESPDPELSAKVLQTLVRLYLEKHVAIHRVPGALDFFQNQTEQYRQGLIAAEERVSGFGLKQGVVAASMEKEITIRKVAEFDADLQKTYAQIAETEESIRALEGQEASTPERLTTQVRVLDNAVLLQQLKTTLLNLELKRSELLSKFTPDYRLVKDIDVQITQAREALANEQNHPLKEETTDRDTAHEWIKGELARQRSALVGLRAQATAMTRILETYRERAHQLNETEIQQEDLMRAAKLAEDNFLLYSRKQEEARIQDALDQRRIINVSIVDEATVPGLPSGPHRALSLALGGLLAVFLSVGVGYTADYLDSTLRTPQEVEVLLNMPVLASLPKN